MAQNSLSGPGSDTRRQQAERSQLARERILDAAVAIVAETGVERFTLAEVGEKAGYSRGLPAKHFRNKPGLISALVERVFRARMFGGKGVGAIEAFVRGNLSLDDLVERRCELALASAALTHPALREQVRLANATRLKRIAAQISSAQEAGEIAKAIKPNAMAIVVLGGVRGALSHWLLDSERVELGMLQEELWRTLLQSMAIDAG